MFTKHNTALTWAATVFLCLFTGCTISTDGGGGSGSGDDNQDQKAFLGCDDKATVVEESGLLACQCPAGYADIAGDGTDCDEINECEDELLNTCHADATCTNTDGSFECACNSGFDGDGLECTDIDECTLGSDTCDDHADCTNTAGGFTCTCKDGWEGDGETCNDINECANADSNNCDVNATCTNIDASYTCECNTGFLGDGESCSDIDECDDAELNECDVNAVCTNTPGTYTCECKVGYNDEGNQGFACSAISCNPIDQPANGTLDCSGNNYNDTCAVTCGNGYNLNGPLEKTCQANGLWSGNDNSCVPTNCGEVIIENGTMTCPSGGTTYPNTCNITCNNGHNLSGLNTMQCTAAGSWDTTAPTCIPADCGVATTPANGSKECANGTTFGNSCSFSCNEGYSLSSNTPITCYADGSWSNESPTCVPASCPTLSAISDGTISLSDDTGTFGDTATYSCDTGYHLEVTTCFTEENNDGGTTEETCTTTEPSAWSRDCRADGTWSDQEASCEPDLCEPLLPVANGNTWSCNLSNNFASTCNLTCNDGYELSGTANRTCGVDGWSGTSPTCTPKDCGTIETPANLFKECTNGTTFGSVCSFYCDEGYLINNYDSLSCDPSGNWSANIPTCTPLTCNTLSALENGNIALTDAIGTEDILSGFYGVTASYTCNSGYHLEVTSCTSSEGSGESCETTMPNSWSRFCESDGTWSNQVATCVPDSCAALPQVDNATAWDCTNNDLFGSQCSLTCLLGHDLSGNATRSCGADGWSGDAPTCTPKDCEAVTAPANGFVELGELGSLYGGAATYSCALGYKLIAYNGVSVGAATTESACTSNGVWSPAAPTCAVQTCTELPTLTNGTLSYANPENTTHVGAEATFTCEDGYHLEAGDQSPSNWTIQCDGTTDGNNGQWSGAAATCEPNVCEPLEAVNNGAWDCDLNQNIFGESCTIVCADGYTQQAGDATRACVYENLQTKWSGIAPYCQGINECETTPDALYCAENASCTDVDPDPGELGYACSCNTGYEDQSNGNGYICELMECTPFVTEVTNAAPPTYENSWYNGTADIICDAGFEYIGGETNEFGHGVVTCNVDNGIGGFMWTTAGTCENIDECANGASCGDNGDCIDDADETPGWYCGCDAGYETVGQWDSDDSNNQPGCAPMACPQYTEDVANGAMVYGLDEYLGTTEIVCVPGYTYVGNETIATDVPYKDNGVITCNVIENGNPTWNTAGTCEDIDECTATDAEGKIVGDCGPNSLACVNDVAGWHCDCKPGFEPSGDWTNENNLPTCVERSWTDVTVGGASEGCMLNPINHYSIWDNDTGTQHSKPEHWDEQVQAPSFACALKSDHTLWCWGYPIYGERPPPLYAHHSGSGSVDLGWEEAGAPIQVGTGADWFEIDAGPKGLCGIRDADKDPTTLTDRTLWCVGLHWDGIVYGDAFQIGNDANWQDIAMGQAGDMCGTRFIAEEDNPNTVEVENSVFCTGKTTYDDSSDHEFDLVSYSDCWDPGCYNDKVHGSLKHSALGFCYIQTTIEVPNEWGELSGEIPERAGLCVKRNPTTGDLDYTELFRDMSTGNLNANTQSLSAGGNHQCAVDEFGSLFCWGSNSNGQLGLGFNFGNMTELENCTQDFRGQTQCDQIVNLPHQVTQYNNGEETVDLWPEVSKQQALWSRVWAGGNNTCAENINGEYYCWGSNTVGQVGQDPSFENLSTPQRMNDLQNITQIAMAGCNSCALTQDGEIKCWGGNRKGTLGKSANKTRPSQIDDRTWSHLSTGMFHTCGVTPLSYGHSLRCWGLNHMPLELSEDDGWYNNLEELTQFTYSLGYEDILFQPTPEREVLFFEDLPRTLATGDTHNYVVDDDYGVNSYGSALFGEMMEGYDNNGMLSYPYALPQTVVYGFYDNDSGENMPVQTIVSGKKHNCLLDYHADTPTNTNRLMCWGNDSCGQVGNGGSDNTANSNSLIDAWSPVLIGEEMGLDEWSVYPWNKVSLGAYHTCGIRTTAYNWDEVNAVELPPSQQLFCWGMNHMGQAPSANHLWEEGLHTQCTLSRFDNYFFEAAPWYNPSEYGEYGASDTLTGITKPIAVNDDTDWTDVATGAFHSCGIRGDEGQLFCWGDNRYGQLGIGNSTTQADVPRYVSSGWSKVFAGYHRTCAIKTSNAATDPDTLWCWGLEAATSLGKAERSDDVCILPGIVNYYNNVNMIYDNLNSTCQQTPAKVSDDTDFNELQFGFLHTCALKTDETLWCWGNNQYGQLGDGDILSTTPLDISILGDGN